MTEKRCYSVDDLQEMLQISRQAVIRLFKREPFRVIRVGNKYIVSKKSFDHWLDGDSGWYDEWSDFS